MSVHITGPVWHLKLPTNRKIVLLKLADCANQHGANAFPSVDTISRDTGVSRRTVQTILAEFRASGVLVAERHELGGRGLSTVYMIDLERARELHSFSAAEPETKASASAATKKKKGARGASFSPPSTIEKGARDGQKGASGDTKGRESFAPEPSLTVNRNRQSVSKKRKTQIDAGWSLPPGLRDWAVQFATNKNVPGIDWDSEAEQFLDHHLKVGSVMADWAAAWRTWARNAVKWAIERRGRSRSRHGDIAQAFERMDQAVKGSAP